MVGEHHSFSLRAGAPTHCNLPTFWKLPTCCRWAAASGHPMAWSSATTTSARRCGAVAVHAVFLLPLFCCSAVAVHAVPSAASNRCWTRDCPRLCCPPDVLCCPPDVLCCPPDVLCCPPDVLCCPPDVQCISRLHLPHAGRDPPSPDHWPPDVLCCPPDVPCCPLIPLIPHAGGDQPRPDARACARLRPLPRLQPGLDQLPAPRMQRDPGRHAVGWVRPGATALLVLEPGVLVLGLWCLGMPDASSTWRCKMALQNIQLPCFLPPQFGA